MDVCKGHLGPSNLRLQRQIAIPRPKRVAYAHRAYAIYKNSAVEGSENKGACFSVRLEELLNTNIKF